MYVVLLVLIRYLKYSVLTTYSALISCVSLDVVIVRNGSKICFLSCTYTQIPMYVLPPSPPLHILLHALNPSWNAALLALHCGNVDQLLFATTGQDALHAAHVCSPWRGLYRHSTISSEAALGWESSCRVCGALCRAVQFATRPLNYCTWMCSYSNFRLYR